MVVSKKRIVASGAVLALGLIAFNACERRSSVTLTWKDQTGAVRGWAKRTGVREYSCYFASIEGSGITPDYGPGDLGTRDPQCMGLGINSRTLSIDDLENEGVRFNIPAGPKRRVRIFGAVSSLGDCSNRTVKDLFGNLRPTIYELGLAEEDIYFGKKITVDVSPDIANVQDVVEKCDSATASPFPPDSKNGRLLALYNEVSNRKLRTYRFESNGAVTATGTDLELGAILYDSLAVTPDGRQVYAYTKFATPMSIRRYDVDPFGLLTFKYEQTFAHEGNRLGFFMVEGTRFGYVRGVSRFFQYSIQNDEWQTLATSAQCNQAVDHFFAIGEYFYRAGFTLVPDYLVRGSKYTDGNACGSGTIEEPLAAQSAQVTTTNAGMIYFMLGTASGPYSLHAYQWSQTDGDLTVVNGPLTIPGPGIPSSLVVDPQRTNVYTAFSTENKVYSFPLDAEGRPSGQATVAASTSNPSSTVFEPSGQFVYFMESTGVSVRFTKGANGTLIEELSQPLGGGIEGQLRDLAYVPIF